MYNLSAFIYVCVYAHILHNVKTVVWGSVECRLSFILGTRDIGSSTFSYTKKKSTFFTLAYALCLRLDPRSTSHHQLFAECPLKNWDDT